MARIADKHGLTNRYRTFGSKRIVKRGRPRKYLFGAPSKKRRTYSSSSYKRRTSYNTSNVEVDTSGCATAALIPFFVILLIFFSLVPIFRCLIPVIIGAGALWVVEDKCKKAWGLPTGRWSKPVSIGWTILTTFAMFVGLIVVLLIQIAHIPIISIIVLAIVYVWLSVLILRRKYNQINPEVANTSNCATTISANDRGGNKTVKKLSAVEHAELAQSNIQRMGSTLDPNEFFQSYKNLIYHQQQVTLFWRSQGGDSEVEELMESLIEEKEDYINEFFDRCHEAGVLLQLKEKIMLHVSDLTEWNIQYMEDLLNDDKCDEEYIDEEAIAKEVCLRVKKNLRIDMAFWNEMHLEFKCNLVTCYDQLQLNYEIKNTSGVPWYCDGGGIEIKANVYNAEGDLLCIEDDYVDDDDLAKNRHASSFLLYIDDIQDAAYIEVYAYQQD